MPQILYLDIKTITRTLKYDRMVYSMMMLHIDILKRGYNGRTVDIFKVINIYEVSLFTFHFQHCQLPRLSS